jgi:oligoendopeptidase F
MYRLSDFIPADLKITAWSDIKPYFDKLLALPINTSSELEALILHTSETFSVYSEQHARAYIDMSCHTDDAAIIKRYEMFTGEIDPEAEAAANDINKKILESPLLGKLPAERYHQYRTHLKREVELFREENIDLNTQVTALATRYSQIAGALTVTIDNEEMTMPQASVRLHATERETRKTAWQAITSKRLSVKTDCDEIFSEMVELRGKIARNAGYANYRDYKHDELERFDYSPDDVLKFHDAIAEHVMPIARAIQKEKRDRLGLTKDFRPWDEHATMPGQTPLKPFTTATELLTKTITIFSKLRPEFGENLRKMKAAGLFDLESRKAKAPGGYNYPLHITGMPFIFMNAAGTQRDLTTLMHECGHAMHTFLTNDEPLTDYRDTPSEMAETASMSMELLTSHLWGEFYTKAEHKRACREHLEEIIEYFPWFAIVDAFQHWIYTNPKHSISQRDAQFSALMERFGTGLVNWSGLEKERDNVWQKQGHIFETPFYYIEYGIAQLGALQIYRNFKKNPQAGLDGYVRGLKLGSSKSLPEVWSAMNINFDFSASTVRDLMLFVQDELAALG